MESTAVKSGTEPQASKRVELPVQGMSCASCVATVEGGLRRTPGVREAAVNLAAERASVIFDPRSVRLEDLIKAVEAAGHAAPGGPGGGGRSRWKSLRRRSTASSSAVNARFGRCETSFSAPSC